ncbi:AAA family ATPase [Paucibacter soli]|uniref:AAA family ATPase n=1 Tax=Paucibacter soli TaxID=3133433 RepID=UPI0030A70C98
MFNQHAPSFTLNAKPGSTESRQPTPLVHTELVLIRGLPGSGKSTMASALALVGYKHFEADMYFVVDGAYSYDASRIRDAHAWCQRMTRDALVHGQRAVVSNTFTMLREIEPYRSMTTNIRIIEAHGKWENSHGVPAEVIQRMADRWEVLRAE